MSLLNSILRGRARCDEIDEVNAATPTAGLGLAADSSGSLKALLAALGKSGTDAKSLTSLVSTLQAVADPTKTNAGDKDKKPPLDIPRGPDGKPMTWIEGMALCRCGIGGGKHLFKDCPKAKEKASKKAKKALAVAAGAAPPAGLTSSDALAAITALLSQIVVGRALPMFVASSMGVPGEPC